MPCPAQSITSAVAAVLFLCATIVTLSTHANGIPLADDDQYDKEYYSSGGAHELPSWLIAQLRRAELGNQIAGPVLPYRVQIAAAKRNSELINSLLRIPTNIHEAGKK